MGTTVTFGGYSLGDKVTGGTSGNVQRHVVRDAVPDLKGIRIKGQGGGGRTIQFRTHKTCASTKAAYDWVDGLGTNIPRTEDGDDLVITTGGGAVTFSNVVMASYQWVVGPGDQPAAVEVTWNCVDSETAMGTY